MSRPGIIGHRAPPLRVPLWRDAQGQPLDGLSLDDLPGAFKLLYCFQSWCPGCHSHGFPTLQRILDGTDRAVLGAAVVQTVFEGFDTNTPERAWELQAKLNLGVPFGHDGVDGIRAATMTDYATGGTPWFVLIAPDGVVIANSYHVDGDALVALVNGSVEAA